MVGAIYQPFVDLVFTLLSCLRRIIVTRVPEERDHPHDAGRFPPTRWTLVDRAAGADSHATLAAVSELVHLYAPALRAHLLHRTRNDVHRAEDLLQGFLTDKVLEARLIGCAEANRGRFRTFLLAALDRYVIDEHRRASAQKRRPREGVMNVDEMRDTIPAADASDFDRVWAREVIDEVLSLMRQQCTTDDHAKMWEVFDARYLRPAIEGTEPEPHETIARRLGLQDARQAGNLLITAKRMFTRAFKSVVARYAINDEEIRTEVVDLWRIFSQARA